MKPSRFLSYEWDTVAECRDGGKVSEPRRGARGGNLSFILADTQPDGPAEALLSFRGEPFLSQPTERDVPALRFSHPGALGAAGATGRGGAQPPPAGLTPGRTGAP